jgi:tRNA (cmo5U34)-methyltransferase
MSTDQLFSKPLSAPSAFRFDEDVVKVFPDMIERSVPGYATTLGTIRELAERCLQDGDRAYDLGSSLGAATLAMAAGAKGHDVELIGVDNSEAMLQECRHRLGDLPASTWQLGDIREFKLKPCAMVVLNFTLQFVDPGYRGEILRRIYTALRPGGLLVLSEKLHFADHRLNQAMIDLHHEFKRANGYSDLEIAQKRNALENVLIPDTLQQHLERLQSAGFTSAEQWYQCFNFASILAVK